MCYILDMNLLRQVVQVSEEQRKKHFFIGTAEVQPTEETETRQLRKRKTPSIFTDQRRESY